MKRTTPPKPKQLVTWFSVTVLHTPRSSWLDLEPAPTLGTVLANMGLARTRDPGGSEGRFDPSAVDPAAASFMKTRFDRREAANSNLCAWLVVDA